MGLANSGDVGATAEHSGGDETEDLGNEDESIVHHTASVGDVEVRYSYIFYMSLLLNLSFERNIEFILWLKS